MTRDAAGISVVIPAYNAREFIGQSIASVLAQTLPPDEIIVVDDGSDDGTGEVAAGCSDRVRILSQENSGPAAARNTGIMASTGSHIAFLDADDLWRPDKLALQMALFARQPDLGLVYCQMRSLDNESGCHGPPLPDPVVRGQVFDRLLAESFILLSSVVVPRAVLQRVGLFDTSFLTAEDTHLYLRIAHDFPVDAVDTPLVSRRKHRDNISDRFDIPVGTIACLDSIGHLFPETVPGRYPPMRRAYRARGTLLVHDYLYSGRPAMARKVVGELFDRGIVSVELLRLWCKSWLVSIVGNR